MKPTPNEPESTLAVILHCDVIGSTALVQRDERKAHRRITDALSHFARVIVAYGGTAHEVRGDALVAEFGRASDAVCAALAFQNENAEVNRMIEDEVRPDIRIGVALGEVVIADRTVTGSGVVLAQRVEQLCPAGGVNITGAVHEALPRRLPLAFERLGEQALKGFAEPVSVYSIRVPQGSDVPPPAPSSSNRHASANWSTRVATSIAILAVAGIAALGVFLNSEEAPSVDAPPTGARGERPSIAVLPFDNLGGDPEQGYFADGITEDLTTDLSRISGLFVVARNSSFAYRGHSVDVRKVAEALGVRYVLEGSVRRVGDQVRINAQLIDGVSGGHIWADRFDGGMSDVFELQDEVNKRIVEALSVNLSNDEREQLESIETTNPQAYDTLLRGLQQYQRFTPEGIREARRLFKLAIEQDPNYARAYANVALTYGTDVNINLTRDREHAIAEGLKYVEKAIALDADIPQVYSTRSVLYLSQRKYDAAIESARRTVELLPDYSDGHAILAFVHSFAGNLEEALAAIRRAKEIDPQYSYIFLAVEGRILYLLKRYEEARVVLEESVSRNPAFPLGQMTLAATYAALGRKDDAEWAIQEALLVDPELRLDVVRRESNYRRPEDLEHYLGALREAGLPE